MLVGVQAQADLTGEDLVLLLGKHCIDLLGGCPGSGAVLCPIPCPALLRLIQADAHDVESGADQDGCEAVLCPANLEGVFQSFRQVGQNIRQASAQGLGKKQGRPGNGDIEKQPGKQAVGFWWLLQQRSSPLIKRKKPGGAGASPAPPLGRNACLVVDGIIVSYGDFLFSVWPERTSDPAAPGSSSASPGRRDAQASSRYSRSLWV